MAEARDGDPLARHALSPAELKEVIALERSGGAFLAYRDDAGRLCFFTAEPERETSTVGRRPGMDLVIGWDAEVSGLHAEMRHLPGEWTIADDGLSTNGTYVDGKRISGQVRLRDGDTIRLGRTTLAYRAEQATLVQATVAAGAAVQIELTDAQRRVLRALCRPLADGAQASPATNQQIAAEVFLGVDAVKMHLRALFARFGLTDLPQNLKRATLAERALATGVISRRELG